MTSLDGVGGNARRT